MYDVLLALYLRVVNADRERGDVPGWVLITLMTAGLVMALWAIAGPRLGQILTDALANVSGP
ncbi:MAG: hypothetical protein ACR2J0_08580 [Mycobacteriales bacterium]|jgi:hypothetical protein